MILLLKYISVIIIFLIEWSRSVPSYRVNKQPTNPSIITVTNHIVAVALTNICSALMVGVKGYM